MGYTHYWSQNRSFTDGEWNELTTSTRRILRVAQDKLGIALSYEYDRNRLPVVDDEVIRFNGYGDEGHETFIITKERQPNPAWRKEEEDNFAFCKTARKPYDAPVVAILIECARINDEFTWSSDGDNEEGYMDRAIEILTHEEYEEEVA